MMHDAFDALNERRIQALHTYVVALSQADLDTVARILQEAEQDAVLERMLLELHAAEAQGMRTPVALKDVQAIKKTLQTYALLEAHSTTANQKTHSGRKEHMPHLKNVAEEEGEY